MKMIPNSVKDIPVESVVLRKMLRRIDQTGVFPRLPGQSTPFLLLDNHGSRLELPFPSYVNDPMHKWVVCIGVPNGASLWQVGDSVDIISTKSKSPLTTISFINIYCCSACDTPCGLSFGWVLHLNSLQISSNLYLSIPDTAPSFTAGIYLSVTLLTITRPHGCSKSSPVGST